MIARAYRYITWLSLDVTAGAIVFMYFLSKEFGTSVHWSEAAALGISVWIIYTVDHLLDVWNTSQIRSPRRVFHRKYANILSVACVLLVGVGVGVLTLLSKQLLISGLILALLAAGYLLVAQLKKSSFFKELQISFGYAVGVSLIPFVQLEDALFEHWLVIGLLFLTALFNLILFSWFEREADKDEGFKSLALSFSEKTISQVFWIIAGVLIIGVWLLVFIEGFTMIPVFFASSTAINLVIWRCSSCLQQNELYRIIGDAVFLIPLVWLL